MRITFSMIGLVGAVALLGACGGDRATVIAKAESDCAAGAPTGGVPGMNAQRFCSCVVGKLAEGKSDAQIRDLFAQKEAPPEAASVVGECTVAEMKASGK